MTIFTKNTPIYNLFKFLSVVICLSGCSSGNNQMTNLNEVILKGVTWDLVAVQRSGAASMGLGINELYQFTFLEDTDPQQVELIFNCIVDYGTVSINNDVLEIARQPSIFPTCEGLDAERFQDRFFIERNISGTPLAISLVDSELILTNSSSDSFIFVPL